MTIKVNLKGNPVSLIGTPPQIGAQLSDIKFVKQDLSEGNLSGLPGQIKIIIAVPSLDTGVCALESKTFNKKLQEYKDKVSGIILSMDLPFAMKRFCEVEGIANVITGSDFRYHEAGQKFGIQIHEGPLNGLLARAVWVTDQNLKVLYFELVPEITQEPDYEKVISCIKSLL